MRVTFLGTGTSSGVPVIGCDCEVCTSDDHRDKRLRTSCALQWTDATDNPRTLLIDAGPDLRQQALRHNLRRCDAILFTHNHVDHTWGLDEVRRFNILQRAPIDIYAEQNTMESLRRVYAHIFNKAANTNNSFVAALIPHDAAPGKPFDVHGLRITPVRLLHGKLPIVGYRVDPAPDAPDEVRHSPHLPFAWCTDVSGVPPQSWAALEELGTLCLDCLRKRRHPTHLTVDQAVDVATRVDADQAWFIHMSHETLHAALDEALPERVSLAYDGLVLHEPPTQVRRRASPAAVLSADATAHRHRPPPTHRQHDARRTI